MLPADIKTLLLKLANAIVCTPVSARMQVNVNMTAIRTGSYAVIGDLVPILEYERVSDVLLLLVVSAMNEVRNFDINEIVQIVTHGLEYDTDALCLELIDNAAGYSISGTNNRKYDKRLAAESWADAARGAGTDDIVHLDALDGVDLDVLNRMCVEKKINIDLWMKVLIVKGIELDRHPTSLYAVLKDDGRPAIIQRVLAPSSTLVTLTRCSQMNNVKGWKDERTLSPPTAYVIVNSVLESSAKAEERKDKISIASATDLQSDDVLDNGTEVERSELTKILRGRASEVVVIHKFAISMTKAKLQCLKNNTWLNDEVISFYMLMLQARNQQSCAADPQKIKSHFFNSFFMERLLVTDKKYTYNNVKSWTKKVDVRNVENIFWPISINRGHWILVVAFMKETPKRIASYDSMGSISTKYVDVACDFLVDDVKSKYNLCWKGESREWVRECPHESPFQVGGTDCGVFLFSNVKRISIDSYPLKRQEHINQFRL